MELTVHARSRREGKSGKRASLVQEGAAPQEASLKRRGSSSHLDKQDASPSHMDSELPSCADGMLPPIPGKRCAYCNTTETPLWRHGPFGAKTLCNACGVRENRRKGRLAAQRNKVRKGPNRRPGTSGQGHSQALSQPTSSGKAAHSSLATVAHSPQSSKQHTSRGMVRVASVRSLRSCTMPANHDDSDDQAVSEAAAVEAAVAAIECTPVMLHSGTGTAAPLQSLLNHSLASKKAEQYVDDTDWLVAQASCAGTEDESDTADTLLTPNQIEKLVYLFDLTSWGGMDMELSGLHPIITGRASALHAKRHGDIAEAQQVADTLSVGFEQSASEETSAEWPSDSPMGMASEMCDNQMWEACGINFEDAVRPTKRRRMSEEYMEAAQESNRANMFSKAASTLRRPAAPRLSPAPDRFPSEMLQGELNLDDFELTLGVQDAFGTYDAAATAATEGGACGKGSGAAMPAPAAKAEAAAAAHATRMLPPPPAALQAAATFQRKPRTPRSRTIGTAHGGARFRASGLGLARRVAVLE